MNKKIFSCSILGCDLSRANETLALCKNSLVSMIHLDVMDGHFVDNISFGPGFIKDLRKESSLVFDTHLMIEAPEKTLTKYLDAGSDMITVHQEASYHLNKCLQMIKEANKKASVALNPATSLYSLAEVFSYVDNILLMSVNPGFCNQSFIEETLDKIKRLDRIRKENKFNFTIEVDGGINLKNAKALKDAGCDILVSASSFFKSADKKAFVKEIEN